MDAEIKKSLFHLLIMCLVPSESIYLKSKFSYFVLIDIRCEA